MSEPNRKCCMMGNLASTSAWYIFTMPLFTCRAESKLMLVSIDRKSVV